MRSHNPQIRTLPKDWARLADEAGAASPGAEQALIPRVAMSMALMLGLGNVLLPYAESWIQIGLFGCVCAINLMPPRWGWQLHLVRWLALPVLAYVYYHLTINLVAEEGTKWLRYIHRALLFCIFLAPYSRCRFESDLAGFAILVLCVFFFSAAFMHTSWFFGGLVLAVLLVLVAFYEHATPRMGTPKGRRLIGNLRLALLQLALTMAVVLVAFVVFPRSLFLQQSEALKFLVRHRAQLSLGYSQPLAELGIDPRRDLLQMTNLHELARTSEEVLQAKLVTARNNDPFISDRPLYFRANLYATYENGAWTNTLKPAVVSDSDDGRADGWIRLPITNEQPQRLRIRQRIRTKPIGDICFTLPDPLAISAIRMKWAEQSLLQFNFMLHMDRDYTVISALPPAWDSEAVSNVTEFARSPELEPYMQIPPRLDALLRNWRPEISNSPTPWTRADHIRRVLDRDYSYSLGSFMPPGGEDPVEHFLLRQKEGYCTHFATAMALIARIHGLPARVATGFCISSPPDPDGFYIICDHHAHAWTEVYLAGQGWIIIDATPSACLPPFAPEEEITGLNLIASAIDWINGFVSEFDSAWQGDLVRAASRLPYRLFAFGKRVLASPWAWAGWLAVLLLCRKAGPLISPTNRRRWRRRFSRYQFNSSVPFYDDFLWIMARAGLCKPNTSTGREFAQKALQRFDQPEISWLTDHFYLAKYGGHPLAPALLDQAERHLQNLEQSIFESP